MRRLPSLLCLLFVVATACQAATPTPAAALVPTVLPTLAPTQIPTPKTTLTPAPQPTQTTQPRPAPQAAPSRPEGEVTFTTEDGITLSGTIFGQGSIAVVLAHMRPTDQTSWQPFAQGLAQNGFTALTFDFRGYGKSGGSRNYGVLAKDVRAALAYLRDSGFDRMVCIGASMGGTACGTASHEAGLIGLVMLSSPLAMEAPLELTAADFADLTYPKLFVASQDDQPYASHVQQMFNWSAEPKQIGFFSGDAHGTYIFDTAHAGELRDLLVNFLAALSP